MADVAVQLRIRLPGTPEVWIAGTPLMLHHQEARTLLYSLAATGSLHTRNHLATLWWSESPESNARHSLRSSLSHLRQALLYRDMNCGKAPSLEPENRPRPATMSCRTHQLPNIVYEPGDDVSMAESRGESFLSEGERSVQS